MVGRKDRNLGLVVEVFVVRMGEKRPVGFTD